ncbi:hypothetical protein [Mycobacterium sp. 94-17]|uniref:hypothetical protein n=1 Tax=Mycobacterium sp. 94-17 TaxID=2986147 RepID=UPI002D1F7E1C|nr:hypothetical protein [Mycobacterium sp. 94-17]MEB4210969.1 hypothetical protein [Mycobacterium sp. 94-17]
MNDDTEASPAPDDPTMGAPQQAWSQAEENDGVEAHFSWERVGFIVAAGAVVVLLAFLVIMLMPHNATRRPSQTSGPLSGHRFLALPQLVPSDGFF